VALLPVCHRVNVYVKSERIIEIPALINLGHWLALVTRVTATTNWFGFKTPAPIASQRVIRVYANVSGAEGTLTLVQMAE
jgi:hypothetical protein